MLFLLRSGSTSKMTVYSNNSADIQQHLQSIFNLLRPEDTLKMAVRLESMHEGRIRYLVVVTCLNGSKSFEESTLLGIDIRDGSKAHIGMVLPVWADTFITLDGDGGFSVSSAARNHIFKPISVQAMWSSLQTLHKANAQARSGIFYQGGNSHRWTKVYEHKMDPDRSCLNEWNAMKDLVSKRPPSPDPMAQPTDHEKIKQLISTQLKVIMTSVDLDEVTSKYIRTRVEEELNRNLTEYKSFIDEEMMKILGQMDTATQIFDYLYLGSEWNASNMEELKVKGVDKILNVTMEIDNFYPGVFDYYNVRVYDDDSTEMLKHWDKTYRYIWKAMEEGSKVLVHCRMGISRSASVVIAFVMKAKNWNLTKALQFVKNKRSCIKPNENFLKQLEVYQGILSASKQRHNILWRSKSETNFNSCSTSSSTSPIQRFRGPTHHEYRTGDDPDKGSSFMKGTSTSTICIANLTLDGASSSDALEEDSRDPYENGYALRHQIGSLRRPSSWSPDDARNRSTTNIFQPSPQSQSPPPSTPKRRVNRHRFGTDPSCYLIYQAREKLQKESSSSNDEDDYDHDQDNEHDVGRDEEGGENPDGDSLDGSLVQSKTNFCDINNKKNIENSDPTVHSSESVQCERRELTPSRLPRVNSVRDRVTELEEEPKRKRTSTQTVKINSRAGLVLNLANQFESVTFNNKSHLSHHHPHKMLPGRSPFYDKPLTTRSFNTHDRSKPTVNVHSRPPLPSPPFHPRSSYGDRGYTSPCSRTSHSGGSSVGLISRRSTKAQSTPETEDLNGTGNSNGLGGNMTNAITSASCHRKHVLGDSIIMTDLSVVPQGTVSKTKEKIESLKRTHSFENPLTRQATRNILKIGFSIESLN